MEKKYGCTVATTVLNRKIGEIENELSDDVKYILTSEFHKFAGTIFDAKFKEAYSDYVIVRISIGVYTCKLMPSYTTFLHNTKLSRYKRGIQFNKSVLVAERNNYTNATVNSYIASDLDDWPRKLLNNFTFRNCLFGANKIIKNTVKGNSVYSGCGIAFDGAGSWIFVNVFAINVVVFGVGIGSSSHVDNLKNSFLVLREGPTDNIFGSADTVEQKFTINFSKAKTKFCLGLHCSGDNNYLFVNENETY